MKNKYFHRFDDIGMYNENVATLLGKLNNSKIPFIIAVIPTQLDIQMAELIKSLDYCIVFQHGFLHENRQPEGWYDEFPQMIASEVIKAELQNGKKMIEVELGTDVSGYVPPWNNTSKKAIKVIELLDFKAFSSQHNNSLKISLNKIDITVDTNSQYVPFPKLKEFTLIREEICNVESDETLLGIMYHPNFYNEKMVDQVYDFVISLNDSNVKYDKLMKEIMKG